MDFEYEHAGTGTEAHFVARFVPDPFTELGRSFPAVSVGTAHGKTSVGLVYRILVASVFYTCLRSFA